MNRQKLPSFDVRQMSSDRVPIMTGDVVAQATIVSPQRKRGTAVAVLFSSVLVTLPASLGAFAFLPGAAKGQNTESGAAGLLQTGAEAFKVEDIAGVSGVPQPLKIQLPENPTVTYSFLMVRNMPPNFTLSAGFAAKNYWAVSLHDIDDLQIVAPEGYEGAFTIEVLLVKGMGADPERRTAKAVFKTGQSAPPIASTNDDNKLLTAAPPDETTAALPSLDPPRKTGARGGELTSIDQSMMERGDTYLKQGDVAAARLLYRQLAKKGFANGAFAMGLTYDPDFLGTLAVRGLQPDVEQAKNWYRMAEELGSAQAAQRLATLNSQGN
jgi:hypothetical protein